MKFVQYIQYFFYVAANWSIRIACVLIWQEIKGEKKYGIDTSGADELKSLEKKGIDISHATMYMPVSYPLLEDALHVIPAENKNSFFDIGCGKGRAMCVAAHFGFNKVTGIDFSEAFCKVARKNLATVKEKFPSLTYVITEGDAAVTGIPAYTDCIFLFNPFDEEIMTKVVTNIQESLQLDPREIYVIYANPLYKKLFSNAGFTEVYHKKKLEYFEISVLKK